MLITIFLLKFILTLTFANVNPELSDPIRPKGKLVVQVDNIKEIKGEILLGVYKKRRNFRKIEKVYKYAIEEVSENKSVLTIEDLPYGKYAVVIFQDFNGNREFDYNLLGLPKEPFGFGNNFEVKSRAPKFREVLIKHSAEETQLKILLQEF